MPSDTGRPTVTVPISKPCHGGEDYSSIVLVAFVIWNRSSLFPWGKDIDDQLEKSFLFFFGGGESNNSLLDRNILSVGGKRFHLQPCAQKVGNLLRLWINCYFKQ